MMRQVIYFLSAVTVAFALGNGKPYQSTKNTKNVFQKQEPHQFASVASFHSGQPAMTPQFKGPAPQAAPSPYAFSYESDGSSHQESSDASGKVTGSYTVTNEDGSVRVVKYVADENGFRADIDTNEAGTKSSNPANAAYKSAFVEPPAPKKYAAAPQAYAAGDSSYKGQYEQKPIQFNAGNGNGAYSYNYEAKLEDGGSSSRSESSDGSGQVKGQYSLSVSDGRHRKVDYSSGSEGFQAKIDTNEFGTKSDSPANVQFYSSAAQQGPAPATASFAKTAPFQQKKAQVNFNAAPIQQQSIQDYSQFASKPSPYSFNYNAQLEDGSSSRTESSDASGKVVGSYSLSVADGRKRTLDYEADHQGFRATVNTNEFGTKADSPADVQFYSNAPLEAPSAPSSYNSHQQFSQKPIPAAFPVEQSQIKSAWSGAASTSNQFKSTNQDQSAAQYNAAAIEQYAPYNFNYIAELEDGGSSSRTETGDGSGKVMGSYSLSSTEDGRKRTVDYSADQSGFRATVNTNEFGTKSDSPADVQFYSSAIQQAPVQAQTPFVSQAAFKPANAGGHYSASAGQYSSSKTSFAAQQRMEPAQPSYQPSPYSFEYDAQATGGSSSRSESSDASGKVTGSYMVRNEDGSMRVVEYVADKDGFRANVKTNEPGTKSDDPADVMFKSDAPVHSAPIQQQQQQQRPLSKSNFPKQTYSQKSSMVSQKTIDAWSR